MTTDLSGRDDSPPLVPRRPASGQRVLAVVVAAPLVAALVALAAGCGGGPPTAGPGTPGPPVTPVSPTLALPPPSAGQGAAAIWPHGPNEVRYSSPEAAVRGFATDLAGFRDPILGPYQAEDAHSGAIEVRPEAEGPVTTVFVRQFRDGSWWVVDVVTADVRITSPVTAQAISSPANVTGEARALGGRVTVRITQDGSSEPLATSVVTGRADGMTPFTIPVTFPQPVSRHGTILLTTESPSDGQVWSTSVVRVQLA